MAVLGSADSVGCCETAAQASRGGVHKHLVRFAGRTILSLRLPVRRLRAVAVLWGGAARRMDDGLLLPSPRLLICWAQLFLCNSHRSAMLALWSLRRRWQPTAR